jgi:hypothetical protein
MLKKRTKPHKGNPYGTTLRAWPFAEYDGMAKCSRSINNAFCPATKQRDKFAQQFMFLTSFVHKLRAHL